MMQFLLCRIGHEYFAFDVEGVRKIAAAVPVSKLPYVAAYIDGLINIDGEVIVQLNLSRLLNISMHTSGELLVTSINGYALALVVDKVLGNADIAADDVGRFISSVANDTQAVDINYIYGEFVSDGKNYLVVALEKLAGLVRPQTPADGEQGLLTRNRQKAQYHDDDTMSGLVFSVANELFALPVLEVNEIVEINQFTRIPGAPAAVVGIATLRDQPILVVSATALFAFSTSSEHLASPQILILSCKQGYIGLLVDEVVGIQVFTQSQLKKEQAADSMIEAYVIARQRVILLMKLQAIFSGELFRSLDRYMPEVSVQKQEKKRQTIKLLKVVLANELCAIPVEHVVRLSDYSNSMCIEGNDKGIVGTVDVDGQIIPLLNINKRLNIRNDENFAKLVVVTCQHQLWALCINEATMLFDLDVDAIDHSSRRDVVKGIAAHNGELISILDVNCLQSTA